MPIPGTINPNHLTENLRAAELKFGNEELSDFNRELSGIQIQGCRLREGLLQLSGVEAPKS